MINPVGYFKIHRSLMTNAIWLNSTPEQKTILVTIIAMANYKPNKWDWNGQKFQLKAGQFVTSIPKLLTACGDGISIQNIRTALKRFENLEFLTDESTNQGRLITILNWDLYQCSDSLLTDEPTGNQQATNRQLTGNQQATNRQLTSKEELKNIKNVKNEKKERRFKDNKTLYAENVSMTSDEFDKLVTLHGNEAVNRMIEILDNYKGASGKKYASDYRAILNWVVARYEDEMKKTQLSNDTNNPFLKILREEQRL